MNERERFIQLYIKAHQTNKRYSWIAQQMGITENAVRKRVSNYRKAGINLPGAGRLKQDAQHLNSVLQKELNT